MAGMTTFADVYADLGPASMAQFADTLDASWVDEALEASGSASMRRRKLPADRAVWVVVGMCMFANRSIRDVTAQLDLVIPGAKRVAPSAIAQARARLGVQPLRWLFERVANAWASPTDEPAYHGLKLYGMDGSHLRVPDSEANFETFGKPAGRNGPSDGGYPQVRILTLMNLQSRLLQAARFDGYTKTSENALAHDLIGEVPDQSLLMLDRGFVDCRLLAQHLGAGPDRHVLIRLPKHIRVDEEEELSDGTVIGVLGARTKHAVMLHGRVLAYQHDDGEPCRLFTTLTDVETYPARELIALYHERWELEIGFDELKTHMRERRESLRSRTPDGIRQEVWGLLLTYNLIRRQMYDVATAHGVAPRRVSFWTSMLYMRDFMTFAALTSAPGNVPKELKALDTRVAALLLPPRRSDRRVPRHVKIKMSNYPRNRGRRPREGSSKLQNLPN